MPCRLACEYNAVRSTFCHRFQHIPACFSFSVYYLVLYLIMSSYNTALYIDSVEFNKEII